MMPPPTLKLYEPPLEYGEGDEDVPEVPPESRHAVFFVCLLIGGAFSAAIWIAAAYVVP